MVSENQLDGSGNSLVSYSNVFNSLNQITSETRNGVTTPYSYNSTGQLTSAGNQNYTYDANGNRNMAGYSVGVANEILTDGTYNYAYDAKGNVSTMTIIATGQYWQFGYNLNDQLTSATLYNADGSIVQQASYVYDVFGNMIAQSTTINGVTTTVKHSYDVSGASIGIDSHINPIWADLTSSNAISTLYMTAGSSNLLARTDGTSAGTYWLLPDRLGSVREVLNNSGVIVDTLTYDPFGNITNQSNSAYQGAFTFTGLRLDPATGLLFAKYRFLLPDGQWSGNDLLGFSAGDMNTRRYVGNNGVNGSDLSGLEKVAQRFGIALPIEVGVTHLGVEVSSIITKNGNKVTSSLKLEAVFSFGANAVLTLGEFQASFFAGVKLSASIEVIGKPWVEPVSKNIVDTEFKLEFSVFAGVVAKIEGKSFKLFNFTAGLKGSISIDYLLKTKIDKKMELPKATQSLVKVDFKPVFNFKGPFGGGHLFNGRVANAFREWQKTRVPIFPQFYEFLQKLRPVNWVRPLGNNKYSFE